MTEIHQIIDDLIEDTKRNQLASIKQLAFIRTLTEKEGFETWEDVTNAAIEDDSLNAGEEFPWTVDYLSKRQAGLLIDWMTHRRSIREKGGADDA